MNKLLILNHTDNETPKYTGGIGTSNAIDLYVAEDTYVKDGEFAMIDMGVSIRVPVGYKADLKPRSSTFKKFGIIQTNSVGLIDYTYSGKDDIIKMPVFRPMTHQAIRTMINESKGGGEFIHQRGVIIPKGTRICQLEILKSSDISGVEEVKYEDWDFENRGGFGSTGK